MTGIHQGFGFVEFRTEADSDYAIKVMNMIKFAPASISFQTARPPCPLSAPCVGSVSRLYAQRAQNAVVVSLGTSWVLLGGVPSGKLGCRGGAESAGHQK